MPISRHIKNFKRLQLLTNYFNHCFIFILIPFLICWIPSSIAITTFFSAIRFYKFLPFFEYFPFPTLFNNMLVVLTVTMVPAASVFDNSDKLYRYMKNEARISGRKKILRKELASLHPFGIKMGPIKMVKKIAILMTYYLISNNVFTLLVTFPEDTIKH